MTFLDLILEIKMWRMVEGKKSGALSPRNCLILNVTHFCDDLYSQAFYIVRHKFCSFLFALFALCPLATCTWHKEFTAGKSSTGVVLPCCGWPTDPRCLSLRTQSKGQWDLYGWLSVLALLSMNCVTWSKFFKLLELVNGRDRIDTILCVFGHYMR